MVAADRQFAAGVSDCTPLTGYSRQIGAALVAKVMGIAGVQILITARVIPYHVFIIGFDVSSIRSTCRMNRQCYAAGVAGRSAGYVLNSIYGSIVPGDGNDILFAIFQRIRFNVTHFNRHGRIDQSALVSIILGTDSEQICRIFLISEILIARRGSGSVGTLEITAIDHPILKIAIENPDIRSFVQFQIALAGIAAGCIGSVQISAIQAHDVVATVSLFNDPLDILIGALIG